nr:VWA domain-containing protein [Prevotella sp. UBA5379]
MFRFEDPIYLWALIAVPVLIVIRLVGWHQRRSKLRKFGDKDLLKGLMPDVSKYRPGVKFWLLIAALVLVVVMLARPQMGTKVSNEKRKGIQAIICLDISNSMLAQDVEPSRLERSKMLVENLVDKFNNDKIGLIVFAGEAYVQLPITSDYVSAKMFLNDIEPGLIQTQGTDIAQAINLAMHSFSQEDDQSGKAIIVITDAEDHEGGAEAAAKAAHKAGINVFVLGVGTGKGAPIPMGNGSYLKDRSGNTVMTAFNEQTAQQIAQAGDGTYIHVDNTTNVEDQLNAALSKLQHGDSESVIYSAYNEQFQVVGWIVLILLILEVCISEAKNPLFKKVKIFRKK